MERRLVAILAADVVGYSRLMEQNEAETFERLRTHRQELFEPEIARHHGRIFKLMGDGLLAEFGSVVDAVECAVVLQRAMAERNTGLAEDRRIDVRIGINLGDVIIEGEDRHGDSVIIAARLQALADPGGVLLSGTAYDHVRAKIAFDFAFAGERPIKNIADPVRIYRLLGGAVAGRKKIALGGKRSWRWPATVTSVAAAAVVIVVAVMWPRETPCLTATSQPMTEGPSIAVLPLDNLSGDPQQTDIVDGIADDLTTALWQIQGLFVIARNSAFAYRGKSCDMRRIAKELGVRDLIEGSVQRSGDTMRVNIQIINGETGGHIWARTFDGSFADHLALQDKITQSIADALSLRVTLTDEQSTARGETREPAAYEAFLRGWEDYRRLTKAGLRDAVTNLEEAVALDQQYSRAYAALAMIYVSGAWWRWTAVLGVREDEAITKARAFLTLANEHPTTLSRQASGVLLLWDGQAARALSEFDTAIARDPGDPWSYAYKGWVLIVDGRYEEALSSIDEAIRRDPHAPLYFTFLRGAAALGMGRPEEAEQLFTTVSRVNSDDQWAQLLLVPTYLSLKRSQDAWAAAARFNDLSVGLGDFPISVNLMQRGLGNGRLGYQIANILRRANLPEHSTEWLSGNELRELLLGHSAHGVTEESGKEHAASFSSDGSVSMSGDWGAEPNGTARVMGRAFGKICIEQASKGDRCAMVFHTYDGTSAKENEFTWVDTKGAFPFSQRN